MLDNLLYVEGIKQENQRVLDNYVTKQFNCYRGNVCRKKRNKTICMCILLND